MLAYSIRNSEKKHLWEKNVFIFVLIKLIPVRKDRWYWKKDCYPSARSAYRKSTFVWLLLAYIIQTRYMSSTIRMIHQFPCSSNGLKTPLSRIYIQFCVQRYILCQCSLQRFLQKTHVSCIASDCTIRRWMKLSQNIRACIPSIPFPCHLGPVCIVYVLCSWEETCRWFQNIPDVCMMF